MNSLQELNNYGSSSLTVTDSRFADIKYSPAPPASPFTQILNITGTNVSVNAGIDITEIINYSTANVRYRVTIVPGAVNPLTGSSISWASLPSGVTLSTVGNVYTLSGINSVAQWQAVKSFTWTLPGNYATKPFWYLQVSVLYYDEELGVERTVDWEAYDEDFYYVAELNASSSLTCNALDVILGSASITSAFTPTLNFIRVKRFQAGLLAEASVTAEGQINADNLYSVSSIPTARLTFNPGNIKGNLTAVSSIVCNGVIVISNMIDRTYVANNENLIFATDTPQIEDANPSGATFSITFSSSLGTFSNSSTVAATSPFTFSGTLAQVNTALAQIRFYPTKDSSASGSFTYTQQKNAVTQVTRTINLTGSAGSFATQTYTFTSSQLWTPPNADLKYARANILLVAGGGAGTVANSYAGQAGGGGGVAEYLNQTLTSQSYSVVVGSGGVFGLNPPFPSAGGDTSAFGYTVYGGQPGNNVTFRGGNSGQPTASSGGSWVVFNGNGGGGAGEIGNADGEGYGGDGIQSTITGQYYGGGGGGGISEGFIIVNSNRAGAPGGDGGGGQGGGEWPNGTLAPATAGTANTGGGGGGGGIANGLTGDGANGGSGVVVVKFVAF